MHNEPSKKPENARHTPWNKGKLIGSKPAFQVGRDRIEKNPDQRMREAPQLVFSKFAEFQSARQVISGCATRASSCQ